MPEFTVKEIRLPELHLPEIKRDEIVRSLSGIRLPDDLARARPRRIKVPAIAVTSSDLGRLIDAGAGIARLVQPLPRRRRTPRLPRLPFARESRNPVVRLLQPRTRRSRWPIRIAVTGAVAVAAWALLRQPFVRRRIDELGREVRERWATIRTAGDRLEIDPDEPVALRAIETATTEADGFVNATEDAGPLTPADVSGDVTAANGADGDGVPAFEEVAKAT